MRQLTTPEIKKLASSHCWDKPARDKEKVKQIAVENFLMSMGNDRETAIENLLLDTELYHWNYPTQKAIIDGIRLANEEVK